MLYFFKNDIPNKPKTIKQGLDACKKYFSQKQFYTMLDILVAQYVLNDGLLMRQHHGMQDEYHVDIAEPLVTACDNCDGNCGCDDDGDDDDDDKDENDKGE